ncbi:thiamine biosynthesis protein ThiF [Streptosporangium lutulentum]
MRPRLKPALRRITRDARTLQFGLHPRHAVVLTDLEPEVRRWVESLDGVRDLAGVLATRPRRGSGKISAGPCSICWSAGAWSTTPEWRPARCARSRWPSATGSSPIWTGSRSPGTIDGGLAVLERRRDAQVRVYGAGRVGAQIVALLAASGVGRICVVDPGTARNQDVVPGGLGWTEVGMSRQDGAVAVARSLAPGLIAWTGDGAAQLADGARRPDLVVLAPVVPLDGLLIRELLAWEIPHLLVTAFEGFGSVGPLVLPGRSTACSA